MEHQELNARQRSIVAIAAFTANGNLNELNTALNQGLDAGLTINEIKEILVQLYAYAGFPRSLNGIHTFMSVMDARRAQGVTDAEGKEPSPLPPNMDKDAYGARVRARLAGTDAIPAPSGYQLFTPAIDAFLKQHLFADIFARDNLDHQSRELATVAALASMPGLGAQLEFHCGAAMNTGLTEGQLRAFVAVLADRVGKREADDAAEVISRVVRGRTGIPSSSRQKEPAMSAHISIQRGAQPAAPGPADYFTGTVRVSHMFLAQSPARAGGASVTFEPGARTAWHTHPLGQTLIVTEGAGQVQEWGGPIEAIRPGDVVWFPAGVKHWHGAAPDTSMTHISICEELDGVNAQWMEKVSDAQYLGK